MKDLLIKIKEATVRKGGQAKCALVGQVYEQLNAKLEKVASDVDAAGLEVDVTALDSKLDELETICDELVKIVNPELQKMLKTLKPRFEQNMHRHKGMQWEQVEKRLREADPKKLWSLNEMERTGGEPDVVGTDKMTGELIFEDRSPDSPTGRRNCCYDKAGEEQLKRDYPNEKCDGNAVDTAAQMGVDLLDETEYREAQKFDKLDLNSWSWLKTPVDKRKNGAALYGGRGDDVDFLEGNPHFRNAAGGFRSSLRV
jgi:hypothetical protein